MKNYLGKNSVILPLDKMFKCLKNNFKIIFLSALVWNPIFTMQAKQYYRSNIIGILLEEVPQEVAVKLPYYAEFSKEELLELKIVFKNKQQIIREEKYYKINIFTNIKIVDKLFIYANKLLEKIYFYDEFGILYKKEYFTKSGKIDYIEELYYDQSGFLKELVHRTSQEKDPLYKKIYTYSSTGKLLKSLVLQNGQEDLYFLWNKPKENLLFYGDQGLHNRNLTAYTNDGLLKKYSQIFKDLLIYQEEFEYNNNIVKTSIIKNKESNIETRKYYSKQGMLVLNQEYYKDSLVKEEVYVYSNQNQIQTVIERGLEGDLIINYAYNGSILSSMTYFKNRLLFKKVEYFENSLSIESLYEKNRIYIKNYYQGEDLQRQEYYNNNILMNAIDYAKF